VTIYEARLQADLDTIRHRVDVVGQMVLQGSREAVNGLLTADKARCYDVCLADRQVNRETRAIDVLCHEFVAKHFPAAGHLRFVSSVLRLDIALERIGDYAVNIAREAVQLLEPLPDALAGDCKLMGNMANKMLDEALVAWSSSSADAARTLMRRQREVDALFRRMFRELLAHKHEAPLKDLFALLDVFKNIARVAAQARNICEETVFVATGEMKQPRVSKVLFVGRGNSNLTQLAEAYARKAFPDSGEYASAGWEPAEALNSDMFRLAAGVGLDLGGAVPRHLSEEMPNLRRYHVIVTFEDGAEKALGPIPFETIFLRWDLGEGELRDKFREITSQISDLMDILRGTGAN